MSAMEFEEWFVYLSHEGRLPSADRLRHGETMAAIYNSGDLRPQGSQRNWAASDFFDADVWTAAAPPEEAPASLAQQVAFLNRWCE